MYEDLHKRAHDLYVERTMEFRHFTLWALLDHATENWQASGAKETLEEYIRENGCPQEEFLGRKVYLLSEYHDTFWAIESLSPEDLSLWAEEHGLDAHTLLALQSENG